MTAEKISAGAAFHGIERAIPSDRDASVEVGSG
jgi:hypothetical protein